MEETQPVDDTVMLKDYIGLCNDLSFLAHLPELCDVTFIVGSLEEPVCAVRYAAIGLDKIFTHPIPGLSWRLEV